MFSQLHQYGTAHPRACGENTWVSLVTLLAWGSSPRVRGKLSGSSEPAGPVGLIPARAGKTRPTVVVRVRRRAHPRACGENRRARRGGRRGWGSSPRVRGKRRTRLPGPSRCGLIPARAGKTGWSSARTGAATAHPRACGENAPRRHCTQRAGGSSPRVRGKPARIRRGRVCLGLIPARAGKTRRRRSRSARPRAHPRACGENSRRSMYASLRSGSSPRVRGKLTRAAASLQGVGLIPARAGKTRRTSHRISASGAHPRACGENALRGAQ